MLRIDYFKFHTVYYALCILFGAVLVSSSILYIEVSIGCLTTGICVVLGGILGLVLLVLESKREKESRKEKKKK